MADPNSMFSMTARAIRFMVEQVKNGNPFYLQISHYAMHEGRECLNKTREKYVRHPLVQAWYKRENKDPERIARKEDPAIWLGMGEDLDGRIGAVLDKIKELGIEDNTYVVLTADNGYFTTVGARIPKPNPHYDPDVYKHAKEYENRITWSPFAGERPLEDDERRSAARSSQE